jgi:transcription elongation factor GreA
MELITKENLTKLQNDLKMYQAERPQVIKRIDEARQQGDLSENAEYHAAKERLSLVISMITSLQSRIANSALIEETKIDTSKIVIGSKVTVSYVDSEDVETFHIVSNIDAGKTDNSVSVESPIGKSLLAKNIGDIITIKTPITTFQVKIISFSW